jgi:nitrogen fixation protein NifU and related proteins
MANLEDLYREIILDHYRNPRNRGELEVPPAVRAEGFNPLCGDEITLFLDVEDGVVSDVRIAAQGCSISQSSASMMSVAIKGRPIEEVRDLTRQFKAMMSIHESALGGEANGDGSGEADDEPVQVDEKALGDLAALQGVVKFPPRIKCATLAWVTLGQGLDDATASA